MSSLANAAARAEILARLQSLHVDSPRQWGKMTVTEMLCHLHDSFLVSLDEKHVSPATGLFHRTVIKFVAIHVPMRWPRNVETRPELKQGQGGTSPRQFEEDRARLAKTLERFCVPDPKLGTAPHPIFGPMTLDEWMRWGYRHCDHHFRQFGA
jgi:hypothetical protein